MKMGLYGLPCAGKSYLLEQIDFMKVIEGSKTMKKKYPDFESLSDKDKNTIRERFAKELSREPDFIMDGHYAFGDKKAFTEADGNLYDVLLYLYTDPEIICERMKASEKNRKYLNFDIVEWQKEEISALREYTHRHNKDFYVIDEPGRGYAADLRLIIDFIKKVRAGYSCNKFAQACSRKIIEETEKGDVVILADGDKTITKSDMSWLAHGYTTDIFDNNFYTGYQSWKHYEYYHERCGYGEGTQKWEGYEKVEFNQRIIEKMGEHSYILTSGDGEIWSRIAKELHAGCFCGEAMSAETKFFITKNLKKAGRYVIAYGDSMNDYYMLAEADEGYLVARENGVLSRSLKTMVLGGIQIV